MARYIDVDKMIDGYSTTFPYNLDYCDDGDLMEWLNSQPTADVAPRAEVAREIFEEIERVISETKIGSLYGYYFTKDIRAYIAELKKKYTEEKK